MCGTDMISWFWCDGKLSKHLICIRPALFRRHLELGLFWQPAQVTDNRHTFALGRIHWGPWQRHKDCTEVARRVSHIDGVSVHCRQCRCALQLSQFKRNTQGKELMAQQSQKYKGKSHFASRDMQDASITLTYQGKTRCICHYVSRKLLGMPMGTCNHL